MAKVPLSANHESLNLDPHYSSISQIQVAPFDISSGQRKTEDPWDLLTRWSRQSVEV